MALVLSERDYKLLTLFTKIGGIFVFAAGTINIVDFGNVWLGLGLTLLGMVLVLAPVPMSVLRPDTYPADGEEGGEGDDGMLTVNE